MKKPAKRDAGKGTAARQRAPRGAGGEQPDAAAENDTRPDAASAEAGAGTESPAPVAAIAGVGEAPRAGEGDAAPETPGPEVDVADLKDRLLRAMAETENLRRRAERESEEARKYAVTGLARDLVGIVDNLRRAIEAAPPPSDEGDGVLKNLLVGVEMTERELLAVLERHDIRAIDPLGEKFDPNYHQAMYEVPDSGKAPGTVVEVTQVGYAIAGRLLRPAAVGIAAASKVEDGAPTHVDTKV